MRILIDNSGYSLLNLGDLAMLQVAVSRLRESTGCEACQVFTTDPGRLLGAVPGAEAVNPRSLGFFTQRWGVLGGLHHFFPGRSKSVLGCAEDRLRLAFPLLSAHWIGWRMRRRGIDATPLRALFEGIEASDAVVATGGGYFADSFAEHAQRVARLLLLASRLGKPIALFGQGLGPLKDPETRALLRRVVNRAEVVALREGVHGPRLLRELGCRTDRVIVTGDDAIELAYAARPRELGVRLGVNVRNSSYSGIGDDTVSLIRNALHKVLVELGAEAIPIPISWYETESELRNIRAICGGLPSRGWDTPGLNTVDGILRQVSECRVVVTGSYHAGVFALSQGIPVVGLFASQYYADKFNGLASQFGEVGCSVVCLDKEGAQDALVRAIHYAWESAEAGRKDLLAAAEAQIALSREAYDRLARGMHATDRHGRDGER